MSNRRVLPGRFRFSFPADSLTVHNTLKDNIMRYLELKIPPPVVALVCVAAMWAVAKVTPAFGVAPEVRWAFVGMFVIAGLFFDFRGLLAFLRARTSINPMTPQRASSLVTTGVYRYTRKPMYLGLACLVGCGDIATADLPEAVVIALGRVAMSQAKLSAADLGN